MNLFQFLSRIRITSIFIILALAANASPVISTDLKMLTPDNFDNTVAQGNWFIEHFSPYCHHCRAFAPTWEKLVQHYESMPDSSIHLAQVDCASYGDLCNKHKVTGYPQMMMYKNGEMVSQFKGPREWSSLTSFINEHAPSITQSTKQATPEKEKSDHIAIGPNAEGMVKTLDESTFNSMLGDGPVFVKFYAPWCGHCKKLAPTWTQIASHFRNKLNIAEVNCEAHKSICKSQDVQGYPSLFLYTGGKDDIHKTEYVGGRKFDQIRQFAESAIAPSIVELASVSDYLEQVQKHPVLYLFLENPEVSHFQDVLYQVSRHLLSSPIIFSSSDPGLRNHFKISSEHADLPVLLAIKDNIPYEYTSIFALRTGISGTDLSNSLLSWALSNRLPSALQLDQDTFQKVMNAPHHPLVVIVATASSDESRAKEVVHEASRLWRQQTRSTQSPHGDVIFTWMDLDKWASWLKSMYGIQGTSKSSIVIADHQNLIYYDTNRDGQGIGLDAAEITLSVNSVLAGQIPHKNSENLIERIARRLNSLLISIEEGIVANPLRSIALILIFLILIVLGIRRLLKEDSSNISVRSYKATSHLD